MHGALTEAKRLEAAEIERKRMEDRRKFERMTVRMRSTPLHELIRQERERKYEEMRRQFSLGAAARKAQLNRLSVDDREYLKWRDECIKRKTSELCITPDEKGDVHCDWGGSICAPVKSLMERYTSPSRLVDLLGGKLRDEGNLVRKPWAESLPILFTRLFMIRHILPLV